MLIIYLTTFPNFFLRTFSLTLFFNLNSLQQLCAFALCANMLVCHCAFTRFASNSMARTAHLHHEISSPWTTQAWTCTVLSCAKNFHPPSRPLELSLRCPAEWGRAGGVMRVGAESVSCTLEQMRIPPHNRSCLNRKPERCVFFAQLRFWTRPAVIDPRLEKDRVRAFFWWLFQINTFMNFSI